MNKNTTFADSSASYDEVNIFTIYVNDTVYKLKLNTYICLIVLWFKQIL